MTERDQTHVITGAAAELYRQHQSRAPFAPLSGQMRPNSLDDAYLVQDALLGHFGANVEGPGSNIAGYKIALTSKVMQELVGLDQICAGVIRPGTVFSSPHQVRAGDHVHFGAEFEIAVTLGSDLPASGAPYSRDSVADAVADCVPAFELLEDRGAVYDGLDGITLVADNCWNTGVVLGESNEDWRAADLASGAARLVVNGKTAGEGQAGDAMGHPFDALAWIANFLAGRGRSLKAGMVVLTGSVVTTRFPAVGDEYRFSVEGLGEVVLRVTA